MFQKIGCLAATTAVSVVFASASQAGDLPGSQTHRCNIYGNTLLDRDSLGLRLKDRAPPRPPNRNGDSSWLEIGSDWLGIYDGDWDGKVDQTIIVTEVNGDEAVVYFAHDKFRHSQGDCVKKNAAIENGELKVEPFLHGARAKFWFEYGNTATLKGKYQPSDQEAIFGSFERVIVE